MGIEIIFLILAGLVVAFGIGVVVLNRRRTSLQAPPQHTPQRTPGRTAATTPPVLADPLADGGATTIDENTPTSVDGPGAAPVDTAPVDTPPGTLRERLAKARSTFAGAISGVLGRSGITDESFDELEEALLRADIGVRIADELLAGLRVRVKAKEITEPTALLDALAAEMKGRLAGADRTLSFQSLDGGAPNVWMFVGVNGVGKTTTIGKLTSQQVAAGRTVLLAAGDTFRAAAAEQLTTWAERSGVDIVRGAEGADPSSVIFDGVERAAAKRIDIVMADTAGRLHTKSNLMDELAKVRRVAEKGAGRVTETLLVIDATTGQNGLTQAREFRDVTDVTGVVLTKLDGSAKGGIVFAIETELGIPVKLVGIGETIGDLVDFDPDEFVSALLDH